MSRHKNKHPAHYTPTPQTVTFTGFGSRPTSEGTVVPTELVINEEVIKESLPNEETAQITSHFDSYRILETRKIGWNGGHTVVNAGKIIRDRELIETCQAQKVPMEGVK